MTSTIRNGTELQPADLDRMRCLTAEVRARLDEMAQITARTLGISLTDETVVKFVPLPALHDDPATAPIEIVCGPGWLRLLRRPPGHLRPVRRARPAVTGREESYPARKARSATPGSCRAAKAGPGYSLSRSGTGSCTWSSPFPQGRLAAGRWRCADA